MGNEEYEVREKLGPSTAQVKSKDSLTSVIAALHSRVCDLKTLKREGDAMICSFQKRDNKELKNVDDDNPEYQNIIEILGSINQELQRLTEAIRSDILQMSGWIE